MVTTAALSLSGLVDSQVFSALTLLAPWVVGGAASVSIGRREDLRRGDLAALLFLFGVGSAIGVLAWALLLEVFNVVRLSPTTRLFSTIMSFASLVAIYSLAWKFWRICGAGLNLSFATKLCFGVACVLIISVFYSVLIAPAQAWDFLGSWGGTASRYADYLLQYPGSTFEAPSYWRKHPVALSMLQGWGATISLNLPISAGGLIFWPLVWVSSALFIGFFPVKSDSAISEGCLVFALVLSVPLIHNHAALGGYSELMVGAALSASTALMSLGISRSNLRLIFVAMAILLLPMALRSNGSAYTISIALAFIFAYWQWWCSSWKKVAAFGIAGYLCLFEMPALIEGQGFQYAGRHLTLRDTSMLELLAIERWSKLVLQSYSVLLLPYGLWVAVSLRGWNVLNVEDRVVILAPLCTYIMTCASLTTDAGFRHALPGADTGNSRFFIPSAMLMLLSVKHAVAILRHGRALPGCDPDIPLNRASSPN